MIYWFLLGLYKLAILTYQDFKNNRRVDDRNNAFMVGVTTTLFFIKPLNLWYILIILAFFFFFAWFFSQFPNLGQGDKNVLLWVYLGYAVLYLPAYLYFLAILGIVAVIFKLIQDKVFNGRPLPFMPVLLVTFLVNNLIFYKFIF